MSDGLGQNSITAADAQPLGACVAPPADCTSGWNGGLKRQQAMVAVGRRAVTATIPSILMHDASAQVADMLGMEYYATAEPSADGASLLVTLHLGHSGLVETPTFSEQVSHEGTESVAGYALEMAHPVALSDLSDRWGGQDQFLFKHGVRSALAAPLMTVGQSFGVLVAGSSRTRQFEKDDLLAVETIAHLVTTTIARSHAEKVLADQRHSIGGILFGERQQTTQLPAKYEGPSGAVLTERRRYPRRSYPYYQRVAPIVDGRLPDPSEFVRVCCNDIAAGGFSFLASEPPLSHLLIVALGDRSSMIYVTAQVVHVTRVKRKDKYTYMVGCAYTGRARY